MLDIKIHHCNTTRYAQAVLNESHPHRHPGKSVSGSASDLSGIHLKATQWIPAFARMTTRAIAKSHYGSLISGSHSKQSLGSPSFRDDIVEGGRIHFNLIAVSFTNDNKESINHD